MLIDELMNQYYWMTQQFGEKSEICSFIFRKAVIIRCTNRRSDLENSTENATKGTLSMGIPVNIPDRPLMAPDIRSIRHAADHGLVLRSVYR